MFTPAQAREKKALKDAASIFALQQRAEPWIDERLAAGDRQIHLLTDYNPIADHLADLYRKAGWKVVAGGSSIRAGIVLEFSE